MRFSTLVVDGLYLNWALPSAALPAPPAPLRYEVHPWQGGDQVFATAMLFRAQGVHWQGMPWLHLSHPQINLRLDVVDGVGQPASLLRRLFVPPWAVPVARAVGWQSARAARLRFPRPSREASAEAWRWRASCGSTLDVSVRLASPSVGEGPSLGDWDKTVQHFRHRSRAYVEVGRELRRIETEPARAAVWPVAVEVHEAGLVAASLLAPGTPWPALHSAFLCPEIPLTFDVSVVPALDLPAPVPQAATSSRAAL